MLSQERQGERNQRGVQDRGDIVGTEGLEENLSLLFRDRLTRRKKEEQKEKELSLSP